MLSTFTLHLESLCRASVLFLTRSCDCDYATVSSDETCDLASKSCTWLGEEHK